LSKKLSIRKVPELTFELDKSLENAQRIEALIAKTK
jgi:ribosome-binding factor A